MARLAYIFNALFTEHDPGAGHPESPERLHSIQTYLKKNGFFNRMDEVSCLPASKEQLRLIHSADYIDFVLSFRGKKEAVLDHGDTRLSAGSVDAALLAAGAALNAVELVFDQHYDKVFAAVRPPGHHALRDSAMGFCVFNNIALCAAYALKKKYVKKILIVDWDVHHGNGTQAAFYDNPHVFYLSLHQSPFYPMSGRADETGSGKGKGFTMNIPLLSGCRDDDYVHVLEHALLEIEETFSPDLVLISAGFDAHRDDPIGGMLLTEEGFYKITELTARFAQRQANGRIISFLEGGYHLSALPSSVSRHLQCLLKH